MASVVLRRTTASRGTRKGRRPTRHAVQRRQDSSPGFIGVDLARSSVSIPIPGFKTVAQVEENASAMAFGPLGPESMKEIADVLGQQ